MCVVVCPRARRGAHHYTADVANRNAPDSRATRLLKSRLRSRRDTRRSEANKNINGQRMRTNGNMCDTFVCISTCIRSRPFALASSRSRLNAVLRSLGRSALVFTFSARRRALLDRQAAAAASGRRLHRLHSRSAIDEAGRARSLDLRARKERPRPSCGRRWWRRCRGRRGGQRREQRAGRIKVARRRSGLPLEWRRRCAEINGRRSDRRRLSWHVWRRRRRAQRRGGLAVEALQVKV